MQLSRQPARLRQPGNGIDSHLLTKEVITTRTHRLGHERSRGPVTTPSKPAVGVLTTRKSAAAPPRHTTLATRAAPSS